MKNTLYTRIAAAYIGLASLAGGALAEEPKADEPQPQVTIDCKTLLADGAYNYDIKKLESAIGCYTIAIQQHPTSILAHADRRTAALMGTFIAPCHDNNSLLNRIYDSDTARINAVLFPQDGSFPEDNLDYGQLDDTMDYIRAALYGSYQNYLVSSKFVPYLKSMEVKVSEGFDFSKTAAALYNCFEQDSEGTIKIKSPDAKDCPAEIRATIPEDNLPESLPKDGLDRLLEERSKPADGGK